MRREEIIRQCKSRGKSRSLSKLSELLFIHSVRLEKRTRVTRFSDSAGENVAASALNLHSSAERAQ